MHEINTEGQIDQYMHTRISRGSLTNPSILSHENTGLICETATMKITKKKWYHIRGTLHPSEVINDRIHPLSRDPHSSGVWRRL